MQMMSAVSMPTVPAPTLGPPKEIERCAVDAGLLLGRSCRVGWAPNGRLVHAGLQWLQMLSAV